MQAPLCSPILTRIATSSPPASAASRRLKRAMSSRIAKAASSAFSGSVNAAITASPMVLTTAPSCSRTARVNTA